MTSRRGWRPGRGAAILADHIKLPLLGWADARDAARARRRKLRRRTGFVAAGLACLGATIVLPPTPRLVWNASASAPVGLYRVALGVPLSRGDMVIARMARSVEQLAAERRYVPRNVPLVKRVAGIAGDIVCAQNRLISLNGRTIARRRQVDAAGRLLPAWRGCIQLEPDTVFLLMSGSPNSFDGRYFGPTDVKYIVGKAIPLWLR